MAVNRDKPDRWKEDIAKSVDFYNEWFLDFAPKTFRDARAECVDDVRSMMRQTDQLRSFPPELFYQYPGVIHTLRMCTAPPLARDRLIGLAGVRKHLVKKMEKENEIPPTYERGSVVDELNKIIGVLQRMLDKDIFVWMEDDRQGSKDEEYRAATVVADRLTGAVSDPIIRNEQERRQLNAISRYLEKRGYRELHPSERGDWHSMPAGTYALRMNVAAINAEGKTVNIPLDVTVQPKPVDAEPLLIEAKSAGDFTNTNKRRKEEAQKYNQLCDTYDTEVRYCLFLCGYFGTDYLGYEAAEGIDWVWEHRIQDLEDFGL